MNKSEKSNSELIRQITTAGLSLAIGALFLGLSYLTVFSDFLIILFVPFLGAFTSLKTNYKGQLLFLIGAICISFIDIQEGFFSFLPNVLMGMAYGNLVKKFSLSFYSYLGAASIFLILEVCLTYPINFFYQVDLIGIYAKLFNMERDVFTDIFPSFYFILSAVQTLITSIILQGELKKVAVVPDSLIKNDFWPLLILGLSFILTFSICYFYLKWLAYLTFFYFAIIACFTYAFSFRVDKKILIILYASFGGLSLLLSGFSFAFLKPSNYYLSLSPLLFYFFTIGLCMVEYSHKHKPEGNSSPRKDLLK